MPACRWGHLYEYCSADYEPEALKEEARDGIASFAACPHEGATGWRGGGAPMHDPHDPSAVSAPQGSAPLRSSSMHQLLRKTAEPKVRNDRHHERPAQQRLPETDMQRWDAQPTFLPWAAGTPPPSSLCGTRPPCVRSLRTRTRTHLMAVVCSKRLLSC